MTRRFAMILPILVLASMMVVPPALASPARSGGVSPSAADDDIPGVPLPASPVLDALDSTSDTDDVYRLWLNEGDVLTVRLTVDGSAPGGFDPRLFLYAPGTASLSGSDEIALSVQTTFPKSFTYAAPSAGEYYLDVWQDPDGPAVAGTTVLEWSVSRPVYRFYNSRLGTHFYTATEAERRSVVATLSSIYLFEGRAYGVNPHTNADTLWRFYKPGTGTHFYTADPQERDRVAATLSHLYQYEGPAYAVSRSAGAGRIAVFRFYNVRNGTHFYTADEAEAQRVQTTLGHTYRYEGAAFFLGQ